MKPLRFVALSLLVFFFSPIYTQESPVKEVFVNAPHAELFCRVVGEGDPIVVLHGGPGLSQDYLLPYMLKLSENNLVIFYDQRSCGFSSGDITEDTMRIEVFVDDLECIRNAFGFKKMTLLGHSAGGFLAMHYAIAHPESIDKLILSNTSPASSEGVDVFLREAKLRIDPYQERLKAIADESDLVDADPDTLERYHKLLFRAYCHNPEKAELLPVRMEPQASANCYKVLGMFYQNVFRERFDLRDALNQLKIPTLIIHGDDDIVPYRTAQSIHESIPGSEYILIKDCGHFPYVEVPELFFKHLSEFLNPNKDVKGRL